MRLGYIFFLGVFVNLLLASIFPSLLLPESTAQSLIGDDVYLYNFNNASFGTNNQQAVGSLYNTLQNDSAGTELLATSQQESNFLESISFFDGLFDALTKGATYLSLIFPFSTLLFLLPGALGIMFGGLYVAVLIYAIIRFIRGA